MTMKKLLPILFAMLMALLPSIASASVTVTATQSGADSGSVMAGKTFTVTASGWSGDCSSAYLDLTSCGVCSVSESQSKSLSGSTVSWTTVTASKANSQSISVSISGTCTPDSGSASFDVINSPSLTATASTSSSSVAQGSTFPLSINIQNSGETTARFGTITLSPSYFTVSSGCSPTDIAGGQSLAVSCTIAASSGATTGAQTMTVNINPNNADSITKSVAITVTSSSSSSSSGGAASSSSSSSGGGAALPPANKTKEKKENKTEPPGQDSEKVTASNRPKLVPGVGLRGNEKLQAAIEKVLAKGKMSDKAVENMLRLSASITDQTETERTFESTDNSSKVTTKMKYMGRGKTKNFVVYDKIPKSFAASSDEITVSAAGTVEVVEKDPEYAIVYGELNPGQTIEISYAVNSKADASVIDAMSSEIYAESVDVPSPPAAKNTGTTEPAASENKTSAILILLALLVIVALVAFFINSKKKTTKKNNSETNKDEKEKEVQITEDDEDEKEDKSTEDSS